MAHGLTPAHHQLLLAIKGHPGPEGPKVSELARSLVLRPHSVVGLIDRAQRCWPRAASSRLRPPCARTPARDGRRRGQARRVDGGTSRGTGAPCSRDGGTLVGCGRAVSDGSRRPNVRRQTRLDHLGDFEVTPRMGLIALLAIPVGAAGAGLAVGLLRLIGLITNVVFYGRVATRSWRRARGAPSRWLVLLAPAAGGLVVGLMARYGSEKIRGHGMPEAIEAILIGGSRFRHGSRCSSRSPRRSASAPAGRSVPRARSS